MIVDGWTVSSAYWSQTDLWTEKKFATHIVFQLFKNGFCVKEWYPIEQVGIPDDLIDKANILYKHNYTGIK